MISSGLVSLAWIRDISAERVLASITSTISGNPVLSAARKPIGVIDIFAGPGGLGEGFSSFRTNKGTATYPFELAVSAEMEKSAHSTLLLRAFYRLLVRKEGAVPQAYYDYLVEVAKGDANPPAIHFGEGPWKDLWKEAEEEALNLTLGEKKDNQLLFDRLNKVRDSYEEMILIGGPPCQAYSLVGRSRQMKVEGFLTKGDKKHFLYKQYLRILADFSPAIFIMENVKGILTSKVGNKEMFSTIMRDLSNPAAALQRSRQEGKSEKNYVLLPIHVGEGQERSRELVAKDPSAFIIRCEDHGAAQARHRVIIMGVREDLMHAGIAKLPGLDVVKERVSVEKALAGLPKLRSGLSRQADDAVEWRNAMVSERDRVVRALGNSLPDVVERLKKLTPAHTLARRSTEYGKTSSEYADQLRGKQPVVLNHETRGHMKSDLGRYMFCAAYAKAMDCSPSSSVFPKKLAPEHGNWDSGVFADRFRVQIQGKPSNTVTSHLSKDGHAFIHWDSRQCRSLTVREAARLQSFPDDYLFLGNRTQQYVQVGNAVPPLVARQIAKVVWSILRK